MLDTEAPDCSLLAMYRASVHQKSRHGYHRLGQETISDPSEPKIAKTPIKAKKVTILPVRMLKTTKTTKPETMLKTAKTTKPETTVSVPPQTTKCSTRDATRSHPLLNFLGTSRRKKVATLKPEFIRYLEYMKEGGRWDADSNRPVIYFK
ncbi:hypothetical protein MRB53_018076 [Persea americana]|uniref:Uncharacterized protein n=1 Tax=Persea americana TaxID=3435 RepID=A0ACC2M6F1_PERAE|nr:hypothetical protein MRB53_018076 [Persea americana]